MLCNKKLVYVVLFCILTFAGIVISAPLGTSGLTAVYQLADDYLSRPEYELKNDLTINSAEFSIGSIERVGNKNFQWFKISFERLNSEKYSCWLLIDSFPTVDKTPVVARYLWQEPKWTEPVEYINEANGESLLPRIEIWNYGWPKNISGNKISGNRGWPSTTEFQGWNFECKKVFKQKNPFSIPDKILKISLNPKCLIGFIDSYTDTNGRWMQKYQFKETSYEQIGNHLLSGFNFYSARFMHNDLWKQQMYIRRSYWLLDDWPAHLYRSNFWGRALYVDEPVWKLRAQLNQNGNNAGILPSDVCRLIEGKVLEPMYANEGNQDYSVIWINNFIDQQFGRGNINLNEIENSRVWEIFWPASWYLLADPCSPIGVVDEDPYLETLIERINMSFGTQISPSIENACQIRVAVGRGIARNMNKRWGTAVYAWNKGTLEPKKDITSLKYFYDKGATEFWFWNEWPFKGNNCAHIPFSYKYYYANNLKEHIKKNPNRQLDQIKYAAKACIVLPYGLVFSPDPILLGIKWLPLERKFSSGFTYRQILANAAVEIERLISEGVEFDISIDDDRYKPINYEELIYIREDGTLDIFINGQQQKISLPRVVSRIDLGEMPSIKISNLNIPNELPGVISAEATILYKTGDLSKQYDGNDLIVWELIHKDNYEFIEIPCAGSDFCFVTSSSRINVPVEEEGNYFLRVATSDIFGRPAVYQQEFEIKDCSKIISISNQWQFSKDNDNVGISEGWYKTGFDTSSWQQITVPAFWDFTAVGQYNGYAWYKVGFTAPKKLKDKKSVLMFEGVDEQAWIYLNGEYIGENTSKSTNKSIDEIWDKPFEIPLKKLIYDGENILTVRVHNSSFAGGIHKNVSVKVRD